MIRFKKSAFALASEAGVPLVPITIVDGYRLMNESVLASRPGRVKVIIHPPVAVSGSTGADLAPVMKQVRDTIGSELHSGAEETSRV